MAEAILLTGKRGTGKTLSSMVFIEQYLNRSCMVASNVNIFPEYLTNPENKINILKLPNVPKLQDFLNLPVGNPDLADENGKLLPEDKLPEFIDETKNGILYLSEIPHMLASRSWNEKGRDAILKWISESRKSGWDLLADAQHIKQIDSQFRDSIVETLGICKNLSKISIPIVTPFFKYFFGLNVKMPKGYLCNLYYGTGHNAPLADRIKNFNTKYFRAYRTNAKVTPDINDSILTENSIYEPNAPFTILSHYLLKGRYMSPFKLYRSKFIMVAFLGCVAGLIASQVPTLFNNQSKPVNSTIAKPEPIAIEPSHIIGKYETAGLTKMVLSDGNSGIVQSVNVQGNETLYKINNKWYSEKPRQKENSNSSIMSTVGL